MSEHDVDLEIRTGPRARARLRVTPEVVQWGDRAIELRDVQHVAVYGHSMTMNFVWAGGQIRFWFRDGLGEVTVAIPDTRAPNDRRTAGDAAAALGHAVFEIVAPRLITALVDSIDQGQPAVLGGQEVIKPPTKGIPGMVARWSRNRQASTVVVDRSTLAVRGEAATKALWNMADVSGATIDQAEIVLHAGTKKAKLIPTTYTDAVLLPQLLDHLKTPPGTD
jgi:hypothetical protein